MKRNRGRNRRPGGQNPNRHYESTGPDVKIRGSAQQIFEKYQQYARDAQSAGDRVAAESYLQHAEHYYRIMAATMPRPPVQDNDADADDDLDLDGGDGEDEAPEPARPAARPERAERQQERQERPERSERQHERRRDRDRDRPRPERETPAVTETVADALAVVDEGGEAPLEIGRRPEPAEASEDAPRSGRRRRGSYRRREESEEAAGEEDAAGVMAIVARGAPRRAVSEDAAEARDTDEARAD